MLSIVRGLLCLSFCLASVFVNAKENEVKKKITGTVLDAETQQPLAYATVAISKGAQVVDGIITDEEGKFTITADKGTYTLQVSYLSYVSFEKEIQLTENLNLGTISLAVDAQALDEVEVVGEQSTLQLKLDKKVFNVGKDLLSQNGSLTEVLNNVPSVSVNLDGGVSLRGNSNVTILINGRPSVLTANNGLEQIPAETIDKVEVITNPSSRYQASGTAGIINIILKKNRTAGFSGTLGFTLGSPKDHKASASLNYRTEKFNLFTTASYRNFEMEGIQELDQTTGSGGLATRLDQDIFSERFFETKSIYLGGDYFINENNTLTASYYKVLINNDRLVDYNYDYYNASNNLDRSIDRKETYTEPMDHNQLEFSYVKSFDTKGKELVVDFQYDFWDDDENEELKTQDMFPVLNDVTALRTRDIESSKDYLLQVDFKTPLNDKLSFETGIRAETRVITSDYSVEELVNSAWQLFNNIDNVLDYSEKIGGVYALVSGQYNKIQYQFGLRTEYTKINIDDKEELYSSEKEYTKVFPTLHLTYEFNDKTSLQASYSKRINRPSFWHLNPFGGYADFNAIRKGNPDMNPSYTDAFELGFLKRWNAFMINPSVYYQRSTDFFQFYVAQNTDGAFETTPINLDTENRLGIELSTTYNPVKWLRLSGDFNYYAFDQNGNYKDVDYTTSQATWSSRFRSRIKFPLAINFQSSFRYSAKVETAQTTRKSQHVLDMGLSKSFFENKLAVTFNASNILDSRIEEATTSGVNFNYTQLRKRLGPRYTLAVKYRFNPKSKTKDRRPGGSIR